jgi:hypothetical protein
MPLEKKGQIPDFKQETTLSAGYPLFWVEGKRMMPTILGKNRSSISEP